MSQPSRRAVAKGLGLAGLAVAVTGCETYGKPSAAEETQATRQTAPMATGSGGKELATRAEIPVGGGKIFRNERVVVTQPSQGQFDAFSAVCTHQGCTVASVRGGTINCPCHGSKFRIADGSVAAGPAPRPLPRVPITVSGDAIRLA